MLPDGSNVNDAGRRGRPEQRQQFQGEQEPGEIVDGKPQLVSVSASAAGPPVRLPAANAGVTHEHVKPIRSLARFGRKPPDLGEVSQVGAQGVRAAAAVSVADFGGGSVKLALVPAVQEHGGPVGGEPVRKRSAQPVGGTGDEDRPRAGHSGDPGLSASCATGKVAHLRHRPALPTSVVQRLSARSCPVRATGQ